MMTFRILIASMESLAHSRAVLFFSSGMVDGLPLETLVRFGHVTLLTTLLSLQPSMCEYME